MIVTTIREALEIIDPDDNSVEQYIYLYLDGETLFYIGQSRRPFERLQEHLGQGDDKRSSPFPDRIGQFILDHHPASLSWVMQVMPLSEIEAAQKIPRALDITLTEQRLIPLWRPCLNVMHNKNRTPLPLRYIKDSAIANEGVILE